MTHLNKVLVLGGTGFVGRALCESWSVSHAAASQGARLRVPTRRWGSQVAAVQMLPSVELVRADVHDDASLAQLLVGCDAVVNLVAILHGSPEAFEAVHVGLPRRVAAACRAAGVRRVVHVSALGVAPDAPSHYLRSKARGEAVWQDSGLAVTILRPSVIFGAGDRFLNLFARLQALAPVVPLAGAQARFQPVWVNDVAQAIQATLQRSNTIGQTIECAGPDVKTLADLVRLAGQASGHPRRIVPLPASLATLQAWAMECLPGEPLMTRDNLASMQVPNVASGILPGLGSLDVTPTPIEAVAPTYLGPALRCARLDALRARHW
jgi:NADH dehydrogenase